jgi:hypothetical protein
LRIGEASLDDGSSMTAMDTLDPTTSCREALTLSIEVPGKMRQFTFAVAD